MREDENTQAILQFKLAVFGRAIPRLIFDEMPNLESSDVAKSFRDKVLVTDISQADIDRWVAAGFTYDSTKPFPSVNATYPKEVLKMALDLVRQIKTDLAMRAVGVRVKT